MRVVCYDKKCIASHLVSEYFESAKYRVFQKVFRHISSPHIC